MKPKEQVRNLGQRFQIETPHVEHVAKLALTLFDGFHLNREERPLLAAAARLHDIGYASDAEHHVRVGLRILEENPLAAFSSREWSLICLIVSLHRRNWRPIVTDELIETLGRKPVDTAMRLAAVLRIADGLDHSHIQDASVLACRRGKKVDKIRVFSRWYANNISWAEGKSDLWEAVFTRSFRIKMENKKKQALFDDVVRPGDSALATARRILVSQYDIMRDRVPGILEGIDPEYLHDYRVALRRFCAALRLFRPLLAQTAAPELEKKLGVFSDRLGAPRDAHVLLEFFQTLEPAEAGNPAGFQALEYNAIAAHRAAAELIESDECLEAVRLMSRLLRVELPGLERDDDGRTAFRSYVRRRLKRQMRQICGEQVPEASEELHAFRKRCRRARYLAEFSAPVCGSKTARLVHRLKAVSTSLGTLRDIDLHTESLAQMGFQGLGKMDARRAQAEVELSAVWKKIRKM